MKSGRRGLRKCHKVTFWAAACACLLFCQQAVCSRLPGMGLRESVTSWNAYVVEEKGALMKINQDLEVVATHASLVEADDIRPRICCAAMAWDEQCIYVGGFEWPTGYFTKVNTSDLTYVKGPLVDFPAYQVSWTPNWITLIVPISENVLYVMDHMYTGHPTGMSIRVDMKTRTADFAPKLEFDYGISEIQFRVSPNRDRFVLLDHDHGARLFRTMDSALLKESRLPASLTPTSRDATYPENVFIHGFDVDWTEERLDIWWTRLTADRPAERVFVTLGSDAIQVQENAEGSPWPKEEFSLAQYEVRFSSRTTVDKLTMSYLSFGDAVGANFGCLTSREARMFSSMVQRPDYYSALPEDISRSFISPDGRYFFFGTERKLSEDVWEPFLCVLDVKSGRIVAEWKLSSPLVGVFFDSGQNNAAAAGEC